MYQAESAAVDAGFQTTVLPISAGEDVRLRADRREVERADREDEPLERAVLEAVPHTRRRRRLLLVDADEVLGVEAEEVDHLARGVDLGLVRGLRLAEHRRRVERRPPRARRGARRRAGRPRRARATASATIRRGLRAPPRSPARRATASPFATSASTWSRLCGITASKVAPVSTRSPPITSGIWSRSADIALEPRLQLRALRRARLVALDRLVDRSGRTEDARCAHGRDSTCGPASGTGGTVGRVRVTRHRYAVEGWGVGELIVVRRSRPRPRAAGPCGRASDGADADDRVSSRRRRRCASATTWPGSATAYGDVPLDLSWCTDFQRELARALRAVPWGEIVSYGELAALAGRPGAARAAGTFCAQNRFALCCRAIASSRRPGSAATARRVWGSSGGSSRSRASSCDRPDRDARGGRPRRARGDRARSLVRPAGRAFRAVPRCRPAAPPGSRRGLAPPRSRQLCRRAARLRAASLARHRIRDPHLPAALVRPCDEIRAPRRRARRTRSPCSPTAGVVDRAHRPLRAPAAPARRQLVLPRRVPPRSVSRRRLARRARRRRTSSCAQRRARAPSSSGRRSAGRRRARRRRTRSAMRSPMQRAGRRSRPCSERPARPTR